MTDLQNRCIQNKYSDRNGEELRLYNGPFSTWDKALH